MVYVIEKVKNIKNYKILIKFEKYKLRGLHFFKKINSQKMIIGRSGHTRLETSRSIPNLAIKQSRAISVLG